MAGKAFEKGTVPAGGYTEVFAERASDNAEHVCTAEERTCVQAPKLSAQSPAWRRKPSLRCTRLS